ncbi:MAG: O-antigen translocase [Bacteroidales bacterium]
MQENKTSYRKIFQATTIFGGVQVFNIIIGIIRSKFIAILLGPEGMGISGLLTSTIGFISGLTGFGLGTSAIKNVSAANASGNKKRIAVIVIVLRRLVWITGLLGTIITIILSPWLSKITFGNKNYTFAFILLSVTLLLNQISTGQSVLLRGTHRLKELAKSGMAGSALGLLITVPLYYFMRLKGIVPGIIISSVIALFFTWYYASKVKIDRVYVSKTRTFAEGKDMIKMGFMISLSGLITYGTSYLLRIYISNTGGVEQVGLYSAGFAIIGTYVGMIFTAMGTDYYPRLSAVASNNNQSRELINQQSEVAILILGPLFAFLIIFFNWIVILLYSTQFIAIIEMVHWAVLGMYFKAATWSIGFILLAKGASRTFFWNELAGNFYIFLFNIAGYKLAGLEGLGISFMAAYIVYFIQVFLVASVKYSFYFNKVFYRVAIIQFILSLLCFLFTRILSSSYTFIIGSLLIILSGLHSFKELDKRIDLVRLLKSKLKNVQN